jgi:hypothetical protein
MAVPPQYLMQDNEELWASKFNEFYNKCHEGRDGRGRDDLDYLAAQVHDVVDRLPQDSSGNSHFENEVDRREFLIKFRERVDYEVGIHRVAEPDDILNEVIWALLQVAHRDQINKWNRQLDIMDKVPNIFTEAKAITSLMRTHFKICMLAVDDSYFSHRTYAN